MALVTYFPTNLIIKILEQFYSPNPSIRIEYSKLSAKNYNLNL